MPGRGLDPDLDDGVRHGHDHNACAEHDRVDDNDAHLKRNDDGSQLPHPEHKPLALTWKGAGCKERERWK